MRHSAKTAICAAAVSCLVGVFANASAQAEVFDFNFGPGVTGTFTTGASSPTDPGFDLITGLTFDLLSGDDDNDFPFSFTNLVASGFATDAAFNPTTAAFINHFAGMTFDDIGSFDLLPPDFVIDQSFSQDSRFIDGLVVGDRFVAFSVFAPLVINELGTTVPEPSTWAMMLIGFAGLGFAGYQRARGRGAVTYGVA
jgi:hypothetical protein